MGKWKCEICNSEFDNFHAQGFNHKIYCPLCYFKELNKRKDKEIDRLNKIIVELEQWLEERLKKLDLIGYDDDIYSGIRHTLNKLKELKEEGK